MTHEQKLDTLLSGLLSRIPTRTDNESNNDILTFDLLCSILLNEEEVPSWEVNFLQQTLIEDGNVSMVDAKGKMTPNITHKGIKFIQDGGYVKERIRKDEQDKLVKSSIESNLRSKWAMLISIISVLIALVSIIIQIAK
jgi:hypothetical protein